MKLLTLNDMAYILNFSLNLVSLGCLQNPDFDWSYRSGKISKNNQIIGYTRFHVNNYEIGNHVNGGMAFASFAADTDTPRNSRSYQRPHSASTSDTWHGRIGHIDLLKLHLLGKECQRVRLRGKKMS